MTPKVVASMQKKRNEKCGVEGCVRVAARRGLCRRHLRELSEGWDVPCSAEGCSRPIYVKKCALCTYHYRKWWRANATRKCSMEGCDEQHFGRGYCRTHYDRWFRYGDPGPVGRLRARNGEGKRFDKRYKYAVKNGKWMPEHRVIMEEHLGRALLPEETVHHRNGLRMDNRIENLQLWSGRHPPGAMVKDQLEWAWAVVERYGMLADDLVVS